MFNLISSCFVNVKGDYNMYNNPYWASWAAPYIAPQFTPQQMYPQPVVQQPTQPIQQQVVQTNPIQQTSTVSSVWNWKVTDNYQSMLMESVPFDGTPVLFMMKNESVFYVVSMVDGKKMINGFSFIPLGNAENSNIEKNLTPEEQNEQRLANLETGMASIIEQLNKLVEVKQDNESNTKSSEKSKSKQQNSNNQ